MSLIDLISVAVHLLNLWYKSKGIPRAEWTEWLQCRIESEMNFIRGTNAVRSPGSGSSRVWGVGFEFRGFGFRVAGFGFRVSGFRFRVQDSEFVVENRGLRVS